MIYLVIAADSYDREQALSQIGGKPTVLEQPSAQEVAQELNSPSLFAKESLVLVRGLSKAVNDILIKYCENPSPSITLIIEAEKLTATSALYKAVKKHGKVIDIPTPPPWKREEGLIKWLASQKVSAPAAKALIGRMGYEKSMLMREVEKLLTYTEGRDITPADVQAVASGFPHETVWELSAAIMHRNPKKAIAVWKELGGSPLAVIPAIRSQMQTGFRICTILANGGDPMHVLPQLKARRLTEAKQYGRDAFRKALVALFDTELLCKNGQESTTMEMLIARLC